MHRIIPAVAKGQTSGLSLTSCDPGPYAVASARRWPNSTTRLKI